MDKIYLITLNKVGVRPEQIKKIAFVT